MELTEKNIEEILKNLGIDSLNEMQGNMLSAAQENKDLILLSPTGTGKTLAYLFPVIRDLKKINGIIEALVIVPSRELAMQIENVFRKMGTPYKVNACYGGHSIRVEKNNFSVPPAILIGTPGRIGDHLRKGNIDLSKVHSLILDEFDKSLEFGFQDQMEEIILQLPGLEKRILISATDTENIPKFAGVENPKKINYLQEGGTQRIQIKAIKYQQEEDEKIDILFHLLCSIGDELSIVFCNHRNTVEQISQLLWGRGIVHETYHGGLEQQERERALVKFRNGSTKILITTDLAARGLDIPEIKNIVHFQIPYDEKTFTHRNGRTARMNASGTIYFVMAKKDFFPPYLEEEPEADPFVEAEGIPTKPEWATVFIGGGKKDKVNKIDIVGFFYKQGKLNKDELGLIEIKDYYSYAAVKKSKIKNLINKLNGSKIKKKKVKIEWAK